MTTSKNEFKGNSPKQLITKQIGAKLNPKAVTNKKQNIVAPKTSFNKIKNTLEKKHTIAGKQKAFTVKNNPINDLPMKDYSEGFLGIF